MRVPDALTLHWSVPVRWWLYHLPHAEQALAFLDRAVVTQQVQLLAPEQIEIEILHAIESDS